MARRSLGRSMRHPAKGRGRRSWSSTVASFFGGDPEDAGVTGCAQDLANAGFIAFAIDYRLAPPGSIPGQKSSGRFPEQYDDVHLAVRAARNDARSNGQVGAVGGSSGGTHAAWVAATGTLGDDRLDVAVCLSGSYDFSDFSPDPNLDEFIATVTNYVGVPSTDTAALRAASPAWVLDATCRTALSRRLGWRHDSGRATRRHGRATQCDWCDQL